MSGLTDKKLCTVHSTFKMADFILILYMEKCRVTESVVLNLYNRCTTMRWKMMASQKNDKVERILRIYTKLLNGNLVNKAEEAMKYGVNERSIQRDMDDIRNFLALEQAENGCVYSIVYNREKKGYQMQKIRQNNFSNGELLAICKLLLGSKAFSKEELNRLLDKLISNGDSQSDQKLLKALISNEFFHYVEPQHKAEFIDVLWELGKAVRGCYCIEFLYADANDQTATKVKLKPLAILFSEHYFYLAAFTDRVDRGEEDSYPGQTTPVMFRADCIQKLKILEERFHIPYSKRFEDGEFRKQMGLFEE